VTNAHESTLTDAILTHLDSLGLPWLVDTIEVQMLLGKKESLRCIYTADTVNASTLQFSLRMRNLQMTMVQHQRLQTQMGHQRFLGRHKTLHLMTVKKVMMKPLPQSVKL
jgi:hypothetical protein